ncbi:SIMPL domain-containing protein [Rudaeicoccus suwonensis]|uniref:SIMPL domain-containing protein n=1 Tax=Rudaeicoccus suwonensis TaxID=657409 RepID=UPI00147719A3|nr:SIMPL domain-containing protein [Rudaeicoccus suwonensis]
MTTVGTGSAEIATEGSTLKLVVVAQDPSPHAAYEQAQTRTEALFAALEALELPAGGLLTENISMHPKLSHDGEERLLGYVWQHRLSVRLRDTAQLSDAMAAAVSTGDGFVRIEGVSLTEASAEDAERTARAEAFERARVSAQQLATLAGRELGQAVDVAEGGAAGPQFNPSRARPAARYAAAARMPIGDGLSEVSVTLLVRWAFAD